MAEEFYLFLSYKGKKLKFKVTSPTDSLGTLMEKLKQLIENVTGIRVNLDVRHESVKPEIPDQQDLSSLFKNINMNIETEEV